MLYHFSSNRYHNAIDLKSHFNALSVTQSYWYLQNIGDTRISNNFFFHFQIFKIRKRQFCSTELILFIVLKSQHCYVDDCLSSLQYKKILATKFKQRQKKQWIKSRIKLHEIIEGLYFHNSLSVCVCVCVSVCQ